MANKLYTEQVSTQIAEPEINPLIKDIGADQLRQFGGQLDELALKNAAQAKRNFDTGISLAASDAMNKAYNEFGNDPQKLNETLDEISSGFAEGITDPQEKIDFLAKYDIKKNSVLNQAQKAYDKEQSKLLKQNTYDSIYSNLDMMSLGFDNMLSEEGSENDVASFKMLQEEAINQIKAKDKDGLYLFSNAERAGMENNIEQIIMERFKVAYDNLSPAEQQKMSKAMSNDTFSVATLMGEDGQAIDANLKDYVGEAQYLDMKKYVKQKDENLKAKELQEWNMQKRVAHMDFIKNPTRSSLDALIKINPEIPDSTLEKYKEMIAIEPNFTAETSFKSLEEAQNKLSYLAQLPDISEKDRKHLINQTAEYVYDLKKANISGGISNDDVESQSNLVYKMANDKVFKEQVEKIYGQPNAFTKFVSSKLMGSDIFKKVEQIGLDTINKTTNMLNLGDFEGANKVWVEGQRKAIKARYSNYFDVDQMESLYKEGKPAIFMMNNRAYKFMGYGVDDIFVEVDPQTGVVK